MKKVISINRPMCIGKTATSKVLVKQPKHAAFLAGDWCWSLRSFTVNEENKQMVLNNLSSMLHSFLTNATIESILFC